MTNINEIPTPEKLLENIERDMDIKSSAFMTEVCKELKKWNGTSTIKTDLTNYNVAEHTAKQLRKRGWIVDLKYIKRVEQYQLYIKYANLSN
jgi:hypothetical protein